MSDGYSSDTSDDEDGYSSDDSINSRNDTTYVIPQRRPYRTETQKLHDSLSSGPVVSRTRSGRH